MILFVILLAMYFALRRTQKQAESVMEKVEQHGIPALITANNFITENGPKLATILDNTAATTTTVRSQVERIDGALTEVIDRTRLQVVRADELATRTLDRVEETTEIVYHRVLSPLRQVAGIMTGVSAGIGALVGGLKTRNGERNDGEMFI